MLHHVESYWVVIDVAPRICLAVEYWYVVGKNPSPQSSSELWSSNPNCNIAPPDKSSGVSNRTRHFVARSRSFWGFEECLLGFQGPLRHLTCTAEISNWLGDGKAGAEKGSDGDARLFSDSSRR
jgi:hypothetical protein